MAHLRFHIEKISYPVYVPELQSYHFNMWIGLINVNDAIGGDNNTLIRNTQLLHCSFGIPEIKNTSDLGYFEDAIIPYSIDQTKVAYALGPLDWGRTFQSKLGSYFNKAIKEWKNETDILVKMIIEKIGELDQVNLAKGLEAHVCKTGEKCECKSSDSSDIVAPMTWDCLGNISGIYYFEDEEKTASFHLRDLSCPDLHNFELLDIQHCSPVVVRQVSYPMFTVGKQPNGKSIESFHLNIVLASYNSREFMEDAYHVHFVPEHNLHRILAPGNAMNKRDGRELQLFIANNLTNWDNGVSDPIIAIMTRIRDILALSYFRTVNIYKGRPEPCDFCQNDNNDEIRNAQYDFYPIQFLPDGTVHRMHRFLDEQQIVQDLWVGRVTSTKIGNREYSKLENPKGYGNQISLDEVGMGLSSKTTSALHQPSTPQLAQIPLLLTQASYPIGVFKDENNIYISMVIVFLPINQEGIDMDHPHCEHLHIKIQSRENKSLLTEGLFNKPRSNSCNSQIKFMAVNYGRDLQMTIGKLASETTTHNLLLELVTDKVKEFAREFIHKDAQVNILCTSDINQCLNKNGCGCGGLLYFQYNPMGFVADKFHKVHNMAVPNIYEGEGMFENSNFNYDSTPPDRIDGELPNFFGHVKVYQ